MRKWEVKLAKEKNAVARDIVQSTFAVNTTERWSGRTFHGKNIRSRRYVILSMPLDAIVSLTLRTAYRP